AAEIAQPEAAVGRLDHAVVARDGRIRQHQRVGPAGPDRELRLAGDQRAARVRPDGDRHAEAAECDLLAASQRLGHARIEAGHHWHDTGKSIAERVAGPLARLLVAAPAQVGVHAVGVRQVADLELAAGADGDEHVVAADLAEAAARAVPALERVQRIGHHRLDVVADDLLDLLVGRARAPGDAGAAAEGDDELRVDAAAGDRLDRVAQDLLGHRRREAAAAVVLGGVAAALAARVAAAIAAGVALVIAAVMTAGIAAVTTAGIAVGIAIGLAVAAAALAAPAPALAAGIAAARIAAAAGIAACDRLVIAAAAAPPALPGPDREDRVSLAAVALVGAIAEAARPHRHQERGGDQAQRPDRRAARLPRPRPSRAWIRALHHLSPGPGPAAARSPRRRCSACGCTPPGAPRSRGRRRGGARGPARAASS